MDRKGICERGIHISKKIIYQKKEGIEKKEKRQIPGWFLVFPVLAFAWNEIVYLGARGLTFFRYHYNMEIPLDQKIPFLPWTIVIYFGCFLFWIVNYLYVSIQEDAFLYRFFSAELLAKTLCLVCFLLLPTTNVRPVLNDVTIWDKGMQFLYRIDSADNLFPSIHCLCSWFGFIAVRKRRNVPMWYQIFSFLFALAVCFSTLATRQHVFADVVSGVLLAEVCYQIVEKTGFTEIYKKGIGRIEAVVFSYYKNSNSVSTE